MQLELNTMIERLGKEKNIDKQLVIGVLREALLTAAKKYYGDCIFETKFNEEIEELELFRYRIVVEDELEKSNIREIKLSEALKMDDSLQLGDEVGEPLSTEQLGRIAVQAAKHVIVQKVAEAEKDRLIKDYRDKKGQILTGIVRRFDKQDLIVDLGAQDAVLPFREQIPMEKFKLKDKIRCFLLDVKKSAKGPQIILSRSNPEMLIRLFEEEVTEITDGTVVIQSAARDPGSRSKIAVFSNEPSVDPVGACVGMKGSRVQAVVQELRGEKIDIIPYDRDPARFVCNALAPADVSKVIVNERLRMMEVVVPDEHLSLAIGKRGQNVRLAAQLTGWKVDIRSETKMKELVSEFKSVIAQIPSLGEMRAEILVNEGYKEPSDISKMEPKHLSKLLRLTMEEAATVIQGAEDLAQRLNAEKASLSEDDDDLALVLDSGLPSEGESEIAAEETISSIVASQKRASQLDPEKVDSKLVETPVLRYWMKLRGVGENTAAVLHAAGFQTYASLRDAGKEEIAVRTGLPYKLAERLYAETTKNSFE
jgi:transcription termination/antitermination protein NusA